ncbi:protein RMD5 homolog [Lathyrus oleraceus]|uniref:protein RMD5 homolog n=1 Tax=Pisum sativum TaxID=3888 RepID=UPI0021D3689B|nr:protein RMD5 homolog [Pisum sativum]
MELNSVKDDFDRVTKKQKSSSSKARELLDQIRQEIERALESMRSVSNTDQSLDCKIVLNELKVEKCFNPDISRAHRNIDMDTRTLNQIITNHFYRQGPFDVGDHFLSAVGEPESAAIMKSLFLEMYQILQAMQNQNLEPALNRAATNSDKPLKVEGRC